MTPFGAAPRPIIGDSMATTTLPARTDIAVVGAGQAGLTMSWYLREAGREHVLLDRRATLGGGWQDRWDAFRLVSPNWTASFPGAPYDGKDPDGFMRRDELIGRVADYAARIDAHVLLGAGVDRLRPDATGGFVLDTRHGAIHAREVVIATGGFHVPHVPAIAAALPSRVLSLHSSQYRREADLPLGAILVVGSGQTGVQLVEELRAVGREVFLAGGAAGRMPRRYRGRDIFHWLWVLGLEGEAHGVPLPNVNTLPDPRRRLAANPQLSGHHGGHDVDLRQIGRDGTTVLGRLIGIDGERARFAPDVEANLAFADRFFDERFRTLIDGYIEATGLDCPPAEPTALVDYRPAVIERLDLDRAGIGSVLWTTGYRQDLGWIEPPITDEMGFARQVRGVTEVPGLYCIGSLWQYDQVSATLFGVGRDAHILAERMGLRPT
jgi:putative flavoprotein involved in K+ transport